MMKNITYKASVVNNMSEENVLAAIACHDTKERLRAIAKLDPKELVDSVHLEELINIVGHAGHELVMEVQKEVEQEEQQRLKELREKEGASNENI